MPGGAHPPAVEKLPQARRAATLSFAVLGAVTATWAARIPAVQDRLGLSSGGLAVVALAIEAGALGGLAAGAAVVVRVGSRAALRGALLLLPRRRLGRA